VTPRSDTSTRAGSNPRVLILVENVPVPSDRRVWPECRTLRDAGFQVVVICPQGTDGRESQRFELVDGVAIHRYPLTFADGGIGGYVREYAAALWHTSRLVLRLGREMHFDVVQACNPPDFLLLTALPLRLRGARLIFDHHDLVPELYLSRFARGRDLVYRLALALEGVTFRLADVVISTNESYRKVALTRGKKRPEDVFVVRNGPNLETFRLVEPEPSLKRGRKHLISYVGTMAPQDGVDLALRALAILRTRRQDWHSLFVGAGDVFADMQRLARELGIADVVEFTGYVTDEERIREVLVTSDVCLAPEPKTPLNDVSTMIKIAEYMAMGRPVVAFDLTESRLTAGDAARYAKPNEVERFAECIDELLDDPTARHEMGARGRARVEEHFSWARSERALLAAYERALRPARSG
jgi:glycosyltransferase involved in cell wall biosynthesis